MKKSRKRKEKFKRNYIDVLVVEPYATPQVETIESQGIDNWLGSDKRSMNVAKGIKVFCEKQGKATYYKGKKLQGLIVVVGTYKSGNIRSLKTSEIKYFSREFEELFGE